MSEITQNKNQLYSTRQPIFPVYGRLSPLQTLSHAASRPLGMYSQLVERPLHPPNHPALSCLNFLNRCHNRCLPLLCRPWAAFFAAAAAAAVTAEVVHGDLFAMQSTVVHGCNG